MDHFSQYEHRGRPVFAPRPPRFPQKLFRVQTPLQKIQLTIELPHIFSEITQRIQVTKPSIEVTS